MPDALLTSLSSTLPPSTLNDVARNLSEPQRAVSRGFELSAAAVLKTLARKTRDDAAMRRTIDTASQAPANIFSSDFADGVHTPLHAPWLSNVQRFTTWLFGDKLEGLLHWISRESGLKAAAAATVFSLGAQSVLDRLGLRIRQEGMTAGSLAVVLQKEVVSRPSVPHSGLTKIVFTANPVVAQTMETDPVIAQTVTREKSHFPWIAALIAGFLLLGALWYFLRRQHPTAAEAPNVTAPTAVALGPLVRRQLPDGTALSFPQKGVEGRLLAFIQDPSRPPDKTSWFDFDRLLFDTASPTLQPQSQEQLRNIAAILKDYPNVHLKIGGYTDTVGSAGANLKLSQDRAANVTNELVRMGISPDRLEAQGYGEDHPVADNSTDTGRALNRRISMLVTQK